MEVSGWLHAPALWSPGKETLLPTEWEAKWTPEPGCMISKKKISCPSEMQMSAHEFIVSVHILIASLIVEIVLFVSKLQIFFFN